MLDAMHELAGFAGSGDVVIPPSRDVGLGIEAEDSLANGVAVVMIVKEPAVVTGIAERRLNCVQVHSGILEDGPEEFGIRYPTSIGQLGEEQLQVPRLR